MQSVAEQRPFVDQMMTAFGDANSAAAKNLKDCSPGDGLPRSKIIESRGVALGKVGGFERILYDVLHARGNELCSVHWQVSLEFYRNENYPHPFKFVS